MSSSFSEEALGAIQNLAVDSTLRDAIVANHGLEVIVHSIFANAIPNWRVAERGSAAIRNLALSEQISISLCQQNVIKILLECLKIHNPVASVTEQVFGAIWGLSNSPENDNALLTAQAPSAVVSGLIPHVQNARVCRKACGALRNLSATPTGAMMLYEAGCNAVLMDILRTHGTKDVRIAEEACGCLKNLAAMKSTSASKMELNKSLNKKKG